MDIAKQNRTQGGLKIIKQTLTLLSDFGEKLINSLSTGVDQMIVVDLRTHTVKKHTLKKFAFSILFILRSDTLERMN